MASQLQECSVCGKSLKDESYTCPRCNAKLCGINCYRSEQHSACSEKFYEHWVTDSLREETENRQQNPIIKQMKSMQQDEEDEELSEEEEGLQEECMKAYLSRLRQLTIQGKDEDNVDNQLREILGGDGNMDMDELKTLLTDEEHALFHDIIKGVNLDATEQMPVIPECAQVPLSGCKEPWWLEACKPVQILNTECSYPGTPLPNSNGINLPEEASKPVTYSCINLLSAYCYIERHNCIEEHMHFAYDYLKLSGDGKGLFQDASTAAIYPAVFMNSNEKDKEYLLSDLIMIMTKSKKQSPPLLCNCLEHARSYLLKAKKQLDKTDQNKKIMFQLIKKLEYMIAWSLKFTNELCQCIPQLKMQFLQNAPIVNEGQDNNANALCQKPVESNMCNKPVDSHKSAMIQIIE